MEMRATNKLIVSLVLLAVLWNAGPSCACGKKFREMLRSKINNQRNKGKQTEEKPAELDKEEASYIQYSRGGSDKMYIEIIRDEKNHSVIIREMDRPPVAMSQVSIPISNEEIEEKGETTTEESTITTVDNSVSTEKFVSTEAIPPPRASQEVEITPTSTAAPEPGEKSEGGSENEGNEVEVGFGEDGEEILSPEDEAVKLEWKGDCTAADWNRCNQIRKIEVEDVIHTQFQRKSLKLDCLKEPILCLRNGWTANRCHILCMARCNRELFYDWDGIVDFVGPCRYRK